MSKTIEEKALDYAIKQIELLGINYDSENDKEIDIKATISDFVAGYELCQKEYEEKLRWIPVEEILPPKNKKVLVKYHNDNLFSTTEFESKDIIKTCNYCGITHWRFIL